MDVEFVIVGDGRNKIEFINSIKKNDVEDMFILMGKKPAEEVPEILSTCDVAFLSFANIDIFKMTIPAKLQSYMACGMPILASAIGETKRIIEEAGCGVCCEIGDERSLIEEVYYFKNNREMLVEMGKNSIEYCRKHFNKNVLMDEVNLLL